MQSGSSVPCWTASTAKGSASSSPFPSDDAWILIMSAPSEASSPAMDSIAFLSFFLSASRQAAFRTFRLSAMTSMSSPFPDYNTPLMGSDRSHPSQEVFSRLLCGEQEQGKGREHQPGPGGNRGGGEDRVPQGVIYNEQLEQHFRADAEEYQPVRDDAYGK